MFLVASIIAKKKQKQGKYPPAEELIEKLTYSHKGIMHINKNMQKHG
jgi:hypothetical protein